MSGESQHREGQDPIAAIEQALVTMRRDQQHGRLHRRAHEQGGLPFEGMHGGAHHGGPPFASDSHHDGPPWRGRGPGGPHDRSLGGAARFRLLDALLAAETRNERMGVSEVAEAISVDQPRASRLVNASADHGLVTRRADERDARRSVVELTDAGRALLESARATRRSAVTDAVADFSPEDLATFAALLGRFVAAWPR